MKQCGIAYLLISRCTYDSILGYLPGFLFKSLAIVLAGTFKRRARIGGARGRVNSIDPPLP